MAIEELDYQYRVGITAGVFDLLHVGHTKMLEEMKKHCEKVIVAVQVDPSKYRAGKASPVETIFERVERLKACRFVDTVIPYETEEELELILSTTRYDIRFIGADHKGKPFTGDTIRPETHYFNSRDHKYSSTALRKRILLSVMQDTLKNKAKKELKSKRSGELFDAEDLTHDEKLYQEGYADAKKIAELERKNPKLKQIEDDPFFGAEDSTKREGDVLKNKEFVTREDFYDEVEEIQNKELKEDLSFVPAGGR